MQAAVSDAYATRLAHSFYDHLAGRQPVLASVALAAARKEETEAERQRQLTAGAPLAETLPEQAAATLSWPASTCAPTSGPKRRRCASGRCTTSPARCRSSGSTS